MPKKITLTQNSVDKMYRELHAMYGYRVPDMREDPIGYHERIHIFVDQDKKCMCVEHVHGLNTMMTWKRWKRFLHEDLATMFRCGP